MPVPLLTNHHTHTPTLHPSTRAHTHTHAGLHPQISRSTDPHPKKLYYVSPAVKLLLRQDAREQVKVTAAGVKILERQDSKVCVCVCVWRVWRVWCGGGLGPAWGPGWRHHLGLCSGVGLVDGAGGLLRGGGRAGQCGGQRGKRAAVRLGGEGAGVAGVPAPSPGARVTAAGRPACAACTQDGLVPCLYRFAQDGLPALLPHVTRQRFHPTLDELLAVLKYRLGLLVRGGRGVWGPASRCLRTPGAHHYAHPHAPCS